MMSMENKSWLNYPSQSLDPNTDIEQVIFFQNVISRFLHCYVGILVPLGLLSAIIILIVIIRNKVPPQMMESLDFYLMSAAVCDLTIILYSFSAITRPGYMEITNLACGSLSCLFNISYFTSQYLLLLMFITTIFTKNTNPKHIVQVSLVVLFSLVMSIVAASLLGTHNKLHDITYCQLDPLNAKPGYDIVKFTSGFCIPFFLILLCFVLLFHHLRTGESSDMNRKVQVCKVLFLHITVMFLCRLFYNIMFLRRTRLKLQWLNMTPKEELVMNIAELAVFSGSCINLIFTLTLHEPCRRGLWNALQSLKKSCCKKQIYNGVEMNSSMR